MEATILFIAIIYFFPTIIAQSRGAANLGSIFLINLFLGWTIIGWLVMLIISFSGETKQDKMIREMQLKNLLEQEKEKQNKIN